MSGEFRLSGDFTASRDFFSSGELERRVEISHVGRRGGDLEWSGE